MVGNAPVMENASATPTGTSTIPINNACLHAEGARSCPRKHYEAHVPSRMIAGLYRDADGALQELHLETIAAAALAEQTLPELNCKPMAKPLALNNSVRRIRIRKSYVYFQRPT